MARRTRKTMRIVDLPTELWIHIFSFVEIDDHRTNLAIKRVSSHWKACLKVATTRLYKFTGDHGVPYVLNPFLSGPFTRSTKFLAQRKEYPQDPIFAEPAVFPPVMGINLEFRRKEGPEQETFSKHTGYLTVDDVLDVIELAITTQNAILIHVQNIRSCDDSPVWGTGHVCSRYGGVHLSFNMLYTKARSAPITYPLLPRRWRPLSAGASRKVLDKMFFKTSKLPWKHYY